MLAGPPNAEMRNRRRPSAGNGTHVRATRRYNDTSVHRGAHALPSTLARRTRASAVLASGGYRSCGLESLQRGGASDTLAGTHKDSLHTRLVHFEGTNFTVTAASPTTTPLPPPKTANEKWYRSPLWSAGEPTGSSRERSASALHVQQPEAATADARVRRAALPRQLHVVSPPNETDETDETDEAPYCEQQPRAEPLSWRAVRDPHDEEARRSRIPTCAHAAAAAAGFVAGCRP